jgi:hypothetical protein
MKIEFTDPVNGKIVRFLRNPYDFITGPKSSLMREAREHDLSNFRVNESRSPDSVDWRTLGTHPDIIERFWNEITGSLPERCQWVVYSSPVLVCPRTGVIFGWAGGSFDYAVRLPEGIRRAAIAAGARTKQRYSTGDSLDVEQIGPDWVMGNWLKEEAEWCLKAYEYALSGASA